MLTLKDWLPQKPVSFSAILAISWESFTNSTLDILEDFYFRACPHLVATCFLLLWWPAGNDLGGCLHILILPEVSPRILLPLQ